jgi:hypothetical protein
MGSVFHIPLLGNKNIAGSDTASIDVTAPNPVLAASLPTAPFPHQAITFLAVNASAAGGTDLRFLADRGNVGFKGSGNASANVSVIPNANDAASAIGLDEDVPLGLDLPGDATTHYVLLRWGIDVSASVNGQVALGTAGSVTFGADGSADAISAVLRRYSDGVLAGGVELIQTADSWMLPSEVQDISSLAPGTWIVAEVEGSLALSLGVQYGLNYNWVKAAKLAGLSGDIGLKVQLGASAALGFNVAGKYAVVVSRESLSAADKKIRLRLFKLAKHGFDFAFDAGITVQADFSQLLPAQADDFLKSIFGVHGIQIVNTLHDLDQWTGSDTTLGGLLAQTGNTYVEGLVKDITGVDPATAFDAAKGKLMSLLNVWGTLDSRTSSLILKFVGDKVDLGPVKQAATLISGLDAAGLANFLADKLPLAGFSLTPLGQYLETAAAGSVLSLLDAGPVLTDAKKVATATLNVLDGSTVETIVENLQDRIAKTLGLDLLIQKANSVLTMADFNSLDKLLQAKLAAFLDKEIKDIVPADVENIRKAIGLFLAKRQDFYQQVLKALNQQYKFEFSATYESATTKTALLDIEFDFAQGDFSAALKSTIDGNFDSVLVNGVSRDLLVDTIPGVSLNQAVLTHGIRRHSHQEFHMPYFLSTSDHLNTANATFVAGHDAGRVFVSAQGQDATIDTSEFNKNRDRRDSTLGVTVTFPADATGAITVHDTQGMGLTYQFRQATAKMTPAVLALQTRPYARAYFAHQFGDGSQRGSFETMVNGINLATNDRAGNGVSVVGDTLLSLDLSVVPSVSSGWFVSPTSPDDEQARLGDMSRAIQSAMRRVVPYFYLQDPGKYTSGDDISALILYASLPPIAADDKFFFDFHDPSQRAVLISKIQTMNALQANMQAIAALLAATPGNGMARFFVPDGFNVPRILKSVTSGIGENDFVHLLDAESGIITSAINARRNLLQFKDSISTNRAQAIQRLAQFSAELTQAFNEKVTSAYGGAAIRPLGTLVFLQTCFAMNSSTFATSLLPDPFSGSGFVPVLASDEVKALLDITVLKPLPVSVPDDFFTGDDPDRQDVLLQTRLVNVGTAG